LISNLTGKPSAFDQKYGYITWKESIAGKKKKEFTFKYKVTHPENYLVSEFN